MAKKRNRTPASGILNIKEHSNHSVTTLMYNTENIKQIDGLPTSEQTVNKEWIKWVSACGIKDKNQIRNLTSHFSVHPLILEDILNTRQRPKVEDFGEHIYIVLRRFNYADYTISSEQISFVVKNNYVITLEESEVSMFKPLMDKMKLNNTPLNKKGEDYLLYALIDYVIDEYLEIDEKIGLDIDELEDLITENYSKEYFLKLQLIRRSLNALRKNFVPVREMLHNILRSNISFFDEENKLFLRDVEDHILRVIDSLDTYRDITTSIADLYFSMQNNKMNEVMKALTVLSTIFMPLTFIVGVYGMNFKWFPELQIWWAYPAVWALMIFITIVMIIYFRKKDWF